MKILRLLCNLLLLIAVTIGISVIQVGVYDLTAAQSSSVDAIYIIDHEDQTAYLNSYGFWVNDIETNFKAEPRYRVRNWSKNAKWKTTVGKWVDYGIDAVVGVIKPIVVPIASVNGMKNYYGMGISVKDIVNAYSKDYKSVKEINDALYELYVIYKQGYGNAFEVKAVAGGYEADSEKPISNYEYDSAKRAVKVNEINSIGSEAAFGRWVNENRTLYKENWKLKKYNSGKYGRFAKKFLRINYSLDESGAERVDAFGIKIENSERVINPAALVLYYQQYVSLIVAFIFVLKYPINFVQASVTGKKKKESSDSNLVA